MTDRRLRLRNVLARVAALAIVFAALLGLVVWYGVAAPDSANPRSASGDYHDRGDEPEMWEFSYMYAVSALAAAWVVGRALGHWRLDRSRLALVPRERNDRPVTDDRSESSGRDDG